MFKSNTPTEYSIETAGAPRSHVSCTARNLFIVFSLMVGLMIGSIVTGRVHAVPTSTSPSASTQNNPAYALQNAVVRAAAIVGPSVVNIDTTATVEQRTIELPFGFPQFQMPQGEQKGQGSGVIISSDGLILTNEHVVHGASDILVTLTDGRKFKGTVQGRDSLSDIALVKINATHLPAATLGDSDATPIGAFVIAIGNPLGFEHTMTFGILSGKGRELPEPGKEFRNLLQTDAAINPGNSGGPLVDLEGRVIGINTLIISQSQSMGFAIPINTARKVADELEKDGKVVRPYIGVMMAPVTDEIAQYLHMPKTEGVVVDRVMPQSPAERAGLTRGDVILEVDGSRVADTLSLQRQIRDHHIGDSITLKVWSNAKVSTVRVRVAEMPQT